MEGTLVCGGLQLWLHPLRILRVLGERPSAHNLFVDADVLGILGSVVKSCKDADGLFGEMLELAYAMSQGTRKAKTAVARNQLVWLLAKQVHGEWTEQRLLFQLLEAVWQMRPTWSNPALLLALGRLSTQPNLLAKVEQLLDAVLSDTPGFCVYQVELESFAHRLFYNRAYNRRLRRIAGSMFDIGRFFYFFVVFGVTQKNRVRCGVRQTGT